MTKTTTSPKTCQHNDTREVKTGYGHTSTITVCNDCGSDVLNDEPRWMSYPDGWLQHRIADEDNAKAAKIN